MTRLVACAIAVWALTAQAPAPGASPASGAQETGLAAAKALYASGDYETALTRLSGVGVGPGVAADEIDEYRSLCLLALGRTTDAQRSLEALVARSPLFKMSDADVSPRLVTMFHDVRKRVLPGTIRDLYAAGKTCFDARQYHEAQLRLETLLALLGDEDVAGEPALITDLKALGEGFLQLTRIALAAENKPAEQPAAAPASTGTTPTSSAAGPKIFSVEDREVTPAVEQKCPLPEWNPPNQYQKATFNGVLKVVIDERGQVESAAMVTSVHSSYDPLLLAATKTWQFRPATRDGQPVKFLKLIPIILLPR